VIVSNLNWREHVHLHGQVRHIANVSDRYASPELNHVQRRSILQKRTGEIDQKVYEAEKHTTVVNSIVLENFQKLRLIHMCRNKAFFLQRILLLQTIPNSNIL
jgi:hypothetical protein